MKKLAHLTGIILAGLVLAGLVLAGQAGGTLAAETDQPAVEEPWQPAGIAGILPIGSWRKPQPKISAASPEDVAAWRKLKFGLFVHWGPVSVQETEIGWSRGGYRRGLPWTWNILSGQVPVEVYDNLYKKFNPTQFDAREWVRIAKDAGTKYLVFTTKHHDGFSNFDTKLSDYKITSPESPYGRDIVRQLADACHEGGILWGIYYSQVDWRHPDYMNCIDGHRRYIKFLHGQMRELLTNYGKVSMIFFDGLAGDAKDWDARAADQHVPRVAAGRDDQRPRRRAGRQLDARARDRPHGHQAALGILHDHRHPMDAGNPTTASSRSRSASRRWSGWWGATAICC